MVNRGFGFTANRPDSGCQEGNYCSYYCPKGYLKAQWPDMQGAKGESIGGVVCRNGKLFKTNPNHGKLCIPGSSKMRAVVRNKLAQDVAICRTNYPGMCSLR